MDIFYSIFIDIVRTFYIPNIQPPSYITFDGKTKDVKILIMIVGSNAPWGFTPLTRFEKKNVIHVGYSVTTGLTILISYITVMFCKTTSFKTMFFLLLKIRSLNVKSVFSQGLHRQCKLHSEYFYIPLVNSP